MGRCGEDALGYETGTGIDYLNDEDEKEDERETKGVAMILNDPASRAHVMPPWIPSPANTGIGLFRKRIYERIRATSRLSCLIAWPILIWV